MMGHHKHSIGNASQSGQAQHPQQTQEASQHAADPAGRRTNQQQQQPRRQRRELAHAQTQGIQIVVDGSNIAWLECTGDGKPKVSNILKVRDELVAKGFMPVILCDAALYHQVDDPKLLNQLIDNQTIAQAPAQTDADYFMLETADRLGAQVVSDDQYKPYLAQYSWIPGRRVPVMIIEGMVEFYEEKLEEPDQEGAPHL